MQIPIISGISSNGAGGLAVARPVNMRVVPKVQGISGGFLAPAEGIVQLASTPGPDRGGIAWRGRCYRVCGTKLCAVAEDGALSVLGDVGGAAGERVQFTYSFDYIALSSGGGLYLSAGGAPVRVTDADLGVSLGVTWFDGYFVSHDGEFIVTTSLLDPSQVDALKYASSEASPDPIMCLVKIRRELYALNRYTTEVFQNVGGTGFPLQVVPGAQVTKGAIGRAAACTFDDSIAFLGSGENEPPSVYVMAAGQTVRLSTDDVDATLATYTEQQLAGAVVEARQAPGHSWLYVHLPDRTLAYDARASLSLKTAVWTELRSGTGPMIC